LRRRWKESGWRPLFEGRVPPESPKPVEPEKEKPVKKPRPVLAPDVLRPGESPV